MFASGADLNVRQHNSQQVKVNARSDAIRVQMFVRDHKHLIKQGKLTEMDPDPARQSDHEEHEDRKIEHELDDVPVSVNQELPIASDDSSLPSDSDDDDCTTQCLLM